MSHILEITRQNIQFPDFLKDESLVPQSQRQSLWAHNFDSLSDRAHFANLEN